VTVFTTCVFSSYCRFTVAAGLDQVAIRIESLGIQAQPFGLRFKGTLEFLGNMTLDFVVAPTLTGQNGVVLKFGWNKDGLDKMLQKLLGPVYVVLGVVKVKSLSVALATHNFDLTAYPALSDNGQNTNYQKGITFSLTTTFDKDSPNSLQRFLSQFLVGDFMLSISITETKLSASMSLPDLVRVGGQRTDVCVCVCVKERELGRSVCMADLRATI
jgi:hypothetical protein